MLNKSLVVALTLVALFGAACVANAAIVAEDLAAYWKLDGDLTDSVGDKDGTLVTYEGYPVDFASGFDGSANGAVDFSSDYRYNRIETDFVIPTGPKSFSLFFTTTRGKDPRFQGLAGGVSEDSDRFYVAAHRYIEGGITGICGDGSHDRSGQPSVNFSPTGTDVATDDSYHMVVLSDDGDGTWNMYYRSSSDSGLLSYSTSYSGSTAGGRFFIGNIGGDTGFGASGRIDDVAFFNRIITPEEAENIWDAGSVQAAIPEPATLSLLVLGGAFALKRRRN